MKKSLNIKSNLGNNIFHEIFMQNEEDDRKNFLEIILLESDFKVKYLRSSGLLNKFKKKIKPSQDYEEIFLKFEDIDCANSMSQKPYELSRRFPFDVFKKYLDIEQTKLDQKKNVNYQTNKNNESDVPIILPAESENPQN